MYAERMRDILKEKQPRNSCAIKTSIGGQALMEGIMMRGPQKTYMAVRNPQGEIVIEEVATSGKKRAKIWTLPVIRGVFGFVDSMTLGYKSLMRSAEIAGLEDMVEEKPKKKKEADTQENPAEATEDAPAATEETQDADAKAEGEEEKKLPAWVMTLLMAVSVVIAVAISLGLFFYAPTKLYELLAGWIPALKGSNPVLASLWKSVFEGVFKIVLLVAYMGAISLMKDIRRTFMYHGAEHKTIFCYEAGLPLTVENVRTQRRFHPRCGTSFLILMLLVSIFISFFIDPVTMLLFDGLVLPPVLRTVLRLALFPLVMGIGYELIRLAGRHDNVVTRIISLPGMWLQHITVFEPTDDMIECAIEAVNRVIPQDGSDRI